MRCHCFCGPNHGLYGVCDPDAPIVLVDFDTKGSMLEAFDGTQQRIMPMCKPCADMTGSVNDRFLGKYEVEELAS